MIQKIYDERVLLAKFFTVGACGFVVNYSTLQLCTGSLHFHRVVSEVIAAAIALQITFVLNDQWTYKTETSQQNLRLKLRSRYAAYIATNSFGSLMTVVMFAIISPFLDRLFALGMAAITAMIWNYVMNKVFIWRHTPNAEA